jgi:hypothetical protein
MTGSHARQGEQPLASFRRLLTRLHRECLKPSGAVTKQLGFPTTTVPKFKPDAAAALKVSSIKIRRDVTSDPIADTEEYLFNHKVALMPSFGQWLIVSEVKLTLTLHQ